MNAEDAARLTEELAPRRVFPMHWDMFARYAGDPERFAGCLTTELTEILRCPPYQEITL